MRACAAAFGDHLIRNQASQAIATSGAKPAAVLLWALIGRRPMAKLSDERMRLVEAYVIARVHEHIRLIDIAGSAGLSQFHFARQFKNRTGLSPMRYVLGCRIDCAMHHLTSAKLPLATIAYKCGFASQSHLTTAFKEATGKTPSAWRAAAQLGIEAFLADCCYEFAGALAVVC